MNPLAAHNTTTTSAALDEFLERYEAAESPADVLAEFCRQRPGEAQQFRDLAARSDRLRGLAAAAAPAQRLTAGHLLGPFQIVREIATGGMGVIYEARQVGLERRVALKTIRSDRASPEARQRFVREQQALALLHHTHIVPVFASGAEGDLQYYGMQFIQGVPLHKLILSLRSGARFPTLADFAAVLAPRDDGSIHDPAPPLPTKFPASYFRFAASIVAQAAAAVHSAHERHVIHRDLKPANLMLDEEGKCWLIDFGLARLPRRTGVPPVGETVGRGSPDPALHLTEGLNPSRRPSVGELAKSGDLARTSAEPAAGPLHPLDAECAAMTQQALGTQPYMSPEHFRLAADERSDVWSLGVVLYELLTLRRAFPGQTLDEARKLIEANSPTPPSQHVNNLPATLTAIFYKATRSEPSERYATAADLARDLRNWLEYRPTTARRVPLAESISLWVRRSPGLAFGSAAALLMASAAVIASMVALSADARLQTARANAATERATLAEQGQRAQRREILMRDLVQLRLSTHTDGWTKKADELIAQIAPLGVDEDLRTQAASCLMGMDAEHIGGFTDVPAWYVALSPDEQWMLTSDPRRAGVSPARDSETTAPTPTRLVEIATNRVIESQLQSPSLVTFLPDGTPLQVALPTTAQPHFQFWDVREQKSLGQLAPPPGWTTDGLVAAVSRDGTHLAIAGWLNTSPTRERGIDAPLESASQIVVLDAAERTIASQLETAATALALSADGQLLATGQSSGQVTIYRTRDRSIVSQFAADRGQITALDLCKSPLVPRANARPALRYYLAIAAAGGSLAVWNLELGTLVNHFRGSPHGIHAVALSEDGTMLASGGRNNPNLWDVATGSVIVALKGPLHTDWNRDVKFSRHSGQLAASSAPPTPAGCGAMVWRLSNGRGITALPGLGTGVLKVWPSSDDALVAGLSHTWQLGVWNVKTRKLLQVFETHQGRYADNSAVAFSRDNRRLAFATQGEACLWDLASQERIAQWPLGKGLCEDLTYSPQGRLILVRADRDSLHDSPTQGGFVGRVYELRVGENPIVLAEYHGCAAGIYAAIISPHGDYVVFDGRTSPEQAGRTVTAIDTATGAIRWTYPAGHPHHNCHLVVNRNGTLVMSYGMRDCRPVLLEASTGAIVSAAEEAEPPYWLTSEGSRIFRDRTVSDFDISSRSERLLCKFDAALCGGIVRVDFSQDGRHLVWGTERGNVLVADIQTILESLSRHGLPWQAHKANSR